MNCYNCEWSWYIEVKDDVEEPISSKRDNLFEALKKLFQ